MTKKTLWITAYFYDYFQDIDNQFFKKYNIFMDNIARIKICNQQATGAKNPSDLSTPVAFCL